MEDNITPNTNSLHQGELQVKIAILEERIELNDEKLNNSDLNINVLNAQLHILFNWIKSQFGVELININSLLYSHLNQQEPEVIESMIQSLAINKEVNNESQQSAPTRRELELKEPCPHTIEEEQEENSSTIDFSSDDVRRKSSDVGAPPTDKDNTNIIRKKRRRPRKLVEGPAVIVVSSSSSTSNSSADELDQDQEELLDPPPHVTHSPMISTTGGPSTSQPSQFTTFKNFCNTANRSVVNKVVNSSKRVNLSSHKRVHVRTYTCMSCQQPFTNRHELLVHLKIANHGLACGHCPKILNSALWLDIHLKTHTSEASFACNLCTKKFGSMTGLRSHKQTHAVDRKKYACQLCGKTFYSSGGLGIHMRSHTGDKPYSCSYCGKCFKNGNTWKTHELKHVRAAKAKNKLKRCKHIIKTDIA